MNTPDKIVDSLVSNNSIEPRECAEMFAVLLEVADSTSGEEILRGLDFKSLNARFRRKLSDEAIKISEAPVGNRTIQLSKVQHLASWGIGFDKDCACS